MIKCPRLSFEPMGPTLGAVASGVAFEDCLDASVVPELASALEKHLILAVREWPMSASQQRALAGAFGPLYRHPFYPGDPDAPEVMVIDHDDRRRATQNSWHADVTFLERPPHVEILYAAHVPELGGDTLWASMYAAYDALSETMQRALTGLSAVHDFAKDFPPARFNDNNLRATADLYSTLPPVIHPVVRTNPMNGRKALFVNSSFTTRVQEVSRKESDTLLAFLFEHVGQPEFNVRWKWRADDVVLWDNRWTQHYAVSDYYPASRRMRRASAIGERPV